MRKLLKYNYICGCANTGYQQRAEYEINKLKIEPTQGQPLAKTTTVQELLHRFTSFDFIF